LPQHRKLRRHARSTDWIAAPLFPRYLFVLIDVAATHWRTIRSTIGVSDIICQGDQPLPMLPGVVEEIIERENDEGFVCASRNHNLCKGDKIRVERESLCDQVGLFEAVAGKDRVVILLNMLGRKVRAIVPTEAVYACV
ncbi:MAG TPA: transcription termination/antitermination NusG family protein, partial [Alphaproteobacteria bacterium]|nr:transcription termination/antitermination NusG family protein [Alphaproteobacteria bacterium]